MDLTDEQKTLVEKVHKDIKDGKKVVKWGGAAGTGKTTCLRYLNEKFPDFAVAAFTGKAASIMRSKGMDANTIHSTIYQRYESNGNVYFTTKQKIDYKGFLIDEASMVGREIHEDLLSFNKPIVFVGDHCQLEPVGDSVNLMADPDYRLETIHRNAGEIAHFADHIRKGGLARTFKSSGKVQVTSSHYIRDEHLTNTDQIICAFNRFRVEMNKRVRHAIGKGENVDNGDKVVCLKNNKKLNIFNGMNGTVDKLKFEKGGLIHFDFINENGRKALYADPRQFHTEKGQIELDDYNVNLFDYGYCITCHKAQGATINNVIVYEQYCDKWDHKRWAYTAASRAVNNVIWIEDKRLVRMHSGK